MLLKRDCKAISIEIEFKLLNIILRVLEYGDIWKKLLLYYGIAILHVTDDSDVYRFEGLRALFKGLGPALSGVVPARYPPNISVINL